MSDQPVCRTCGSDDPEVFGGDCFADGYHDAFHKRHTWTEAGEPPVVNTSFAGLSPIEAWDKFAAYYGDEWDKAMGRYQFERQTMIDKALADARREALEDACKATCWRCEMGPKKQPILEDYPGHWIHGTRRSHYGPCDATSIRALQNADTEGKR